MKKNYVVFFWMQKLEFDYYEIPINLYETFKVDIKNNMNMYVFKNTFMYNKKVQVKRLHI